MKCNLTQLGGVCVDGYLVCVSLGSLAIPLGVPEATGQIIRVHVRGLTSVGTREQGSALLYLVFEAWSALSLPTIFSECQPIWTVQTLCLQVIIIYIYIFLT